MKPCIILCIDDEPIRYRQLKSLTSEYFNNTVVVTTCRLEDFHEYLNGPNTILGVCLDHDMPYIKGTYFAGILREYNKPVAITSLNTDGAKKMEHMFKEYLTPCLVIPCTTPDWEATVLQWWYNMYSASKGIGPS